MRIILRVFAIIMMASTLFLGCEEAHDKTSVSLEEYMYNSYRLPITGEPLQEDETLVFSTNKAWERTYSRSADVLTADVRFRLSLLDMNKDGRFNTVGVDAVVLSFYGQDSTILDVTRQNIGVLRDKTFIQIDRSFFLLDDIAEKGSSLDLLDWERCPSDMVTATMKSRLREMPVKTLGGEEEHIVFNKKNGKKQLLFVWNYNSKDVELLRKLKATSAEWRDDYTVTGFNMSDDSDKLRQFLQEEKLGITMYLVGGNTCRYIDCHAVLPYGIVLDEKGVIIGTHKKPHEIMELLGVS